MPLATYIPAKLAKSQVDGTGVVNFSSDTIIALVVVAGSGVPATSKTGVQFVSDVTAANSEVTGTGYARQTLSGKTVAFDGSLTNAVDFSFTTFTFTQNAAGFSNGRYIILAKDVGGSDTTRPVVAVIDPNQTLSVVGGQIDVSSPSGGLIQWTVP